MWDIIALDLDGTLLDEHHAIASETKEQLAGLAAAGTWITIATGRDFPDTLRFMEENGLGVEVGYPHSLICEERDLYFLTDGQYQPDELWNDAIVRKERIDLPRVRAYMADYGLRSSFYINSEALQQERGFVEFVFRSTQAAQEFCSNAPQDPNWPAGFKAVRNHHGVSLRRVEGGKAPVLQELMRRLQADPQRVLAAGDSHNDLEMLCCGIRPATTANAEDEVQTAVESNGGYVSGLERSLGVADILKVHRQAGSFHSTTPKAAEQQT